MRGGRSGDGGVGRRGVGWRLTGRVPAIKPYHRRTTFISPYTRVHPCPHSHRHSHPHSHPHSHNHTSLIINALILYTCLVQVRTLSPWTSQSSSRTTWRFGRRSCHGVLAPSSAPSFAGVASLRMTWILWSATSSKARHSGDEVTDGIKKNWGGWWSVVSWVSDIHSH